MEISNRLREVIENIKTYHQNMYKTQQEYEALLKQNKKALATSKRIHFIQQSNKAEKSLDLLVSMISASISDITYKSNGKTFKARLVNLNEDEIKYLFSEMAKAKGIEIQILEIKFSQTFLGGI